MAAKHEKIEIDGMPGKFDIDDPKLPDWIDDNALSSGGYPYDKKIDRDDYEKELFKLQTELAKLQYHVQASGERIVAVFEGRDTAGKGGCIKRIMMYLNPREARTVALAKPTETERGQWYFQRYAVHLPTAGEIVLFDRSWYNRAGVERVMGYCNEKQLANFLRMAPRFENMLVDDGIRFFKFFLTISQEMQLKRFHARRHDILKHWKLSPNDLASIPKWDAYTEARREMFHFTHTATCPWTVVRANDQRRARLESIRHILSSMDYANKDKKTVGKPDNKIITNDPADFFDDDDNI
jgi:polyphosphate kinase